MSRALPSTKKTHSEQHKQILKQLLKEEANKTCVDCKSLKNPRWASWNLGCFLCIRCSGIHRSMGTHISKVKSVDLDAWTDEQINSMVNWGNEKCNLYWESKLPGEYIPDQSKLDNFIRTKYEMKKWAKSSTIPNPTKLNHDKKLQPSQDSTTNQGKISLKNSINQSNNSISHDLLSSPPKTQSKLSTNPKPSIDLFDDDTFGAFTSSPSPSPSPQIVAPTRQTPQSAQSTGGSLGRPDLKKSILSLYSSPSNSNQYLPRNNHQSYQQPVQSTKSNQAQPLKPVASQPSSAYDFNSLSSSLNGLNFNSNNNINSPKDNSSNYKPPSSYNTPSFNSSSNIVSTPKPSWNNEWNDNNSSSSSLNTWSNLNGTKINSSNSNLDEDLFKNVWS